MAAWPHSRGGSAPVEVTKAAYCSLVTSVAPCQKGSSTILCRGNSEARARIPVSSISSMAAALSMPIP